MPHPIYRFREILSELRARCTRRRWRRLVPIRTAASRTPRRFPAASDAAARRGPSSPSSSPAAASSCGTRHGPRLDAGPHPPQPARAGPLGAHPTPRRRRPHRGRSLGRRPHHGSREPFRRRHLGGAGLPQDPVGGPPRRAHRRGHPRLPPRPLRPGARAAAPIPHLGPGPRDDRPPAPRRRPRHGGVLLRPARTVATTHQREHQPAPPTMAPQRHRPQPVPPTPPRRDRPPPQHHAPPPPPMGHSQRPLPFPLSRPPVERAVTACSRRVPLVRSAERTARPGRRNDDEVHEHQLLDQHVARAD